MSSNKNIVVVGGGGAGAQIARTLSTKLDGAKYSLTLISPREYYLHLPGALRMLVSPDGKLEERVLVPYDKLLVNGNGTILRAAVTSIQKNPSGAGGTVTTDIGSDVPYDVLVLASGSLWEGGLDLPPLREDAVRFIGSYREKVKNSTGVAIVGGGPVGTELAGEIRDVYPDKKITIVHKEPHLLSAVYPDKFRIDVDNRWTQRQILLDLNDRIDHIPEYPASNVVTVNGQRVEADLVIPTRGGKPNTAYIASLGEDVLTADGHVKVDPTLQVSGVPGVFAAGDILDWKEVKQVAKYGGHVTTICTNIVSYLNGQPLGATYKSMFEAIFLTNGAGGGAAYMDILWGLCFGNWVTRLLKSADLFITKNMQSMGYA